MWFRRVGDRQFAAATMEIVASDDILTFPSSWNKRKCVLIWRCSAGCAASFGRQHQPPPVTLVPLTSLANYWRDFKYSMIAVISSSVIMPFCDGISG